MKKIVICSDGTWNKPEEYKKEHYPTNILKIARSIAPEHNQQVFYDHGVGSYGNIFSKVLGGITGKGIEKNIKDAYRYIVQNYSPGDKIYLFGFSRGAYTVRALCGLINNCGIVKRENASAIDEAFNIYKNTHKDYKPSGAMAQKFFLENAHPSKEITFVGVFDTVGALGIPVSFLKFWGKKKYKFYDHKVSSNVKVARHALAIDEKRNDFKPTLWKKSDTTDIKQVWFAGVHSNVGGNYGPDEKDQSFISDIPLQWMMDEVASLENDDALAFECHMLNSLTYNALSRIDKSREHVYRLRKKLHRPIDHKTTEILIHESVKERWENNKAYRPIQLERFLEKESFAWDNFTEWKKDVQYKC